MAVSAGDKLRCAIRCKLDGIEDIVNVLHMQIVTPPSPNNDATVLADLEEILGTAYEEISAIQSAAVDAVDLTVYNITDDRPIGVIPLTTYGGGDSAADALPPTDALLVLLQTGIKRRQGRIYLGGFIESHQSSGIWSATALAAAGTLAGTLTGPLVTTYGTEAVLVLWSDTDGAAHAVTSVRAQPLVAVMRSRKRGRGS